MREIERIKQVYKQRDKSADIGSLWAEENPRVKCMVRQRRRALKAMLGSFGVSDCAGLDILDVGCGAGQVLETFTQWGAEPTRLHGLDLMENRIEIARRLLPASHFHCGNAEGLPYGDERFDLVMHFTVFSSILDKSMRRNLAAEMLRVAKPGALLVWYDMRPVPLIGRAIAEVFQAFRQPVKAAKKIVRPLLFRSKPAAGPAYIEPVDLTEIRQLFGPHPMKVDTVNLPINLGSDRNRLSRLFSDALHALSPMRTHYLVGIRKADDA